MSLRVLIADDHTIVREGLRSLLEKEPDLVVVAEAGSGSAALQLAREHHPDVVLMDISMPDMNGIDATRMIRAEQSDARILALSMETDRRFVVEVLKAGATGYLLKDCAFAELATAVRAVARDETYLPPKIIELVIKDYLQRVPDNAASDYGRLTTRER